MPKTVSVKKDGISQTVHVHIHEKSKEKKRRQKRRKVSRGGAIRTIKRGNLTSSSIGSNIGFGTGAYQGLPQMVRTAQQLLVLPEGDKALGQVGVKQLTAGEQIGLQKQLILDSIKEYESQVMGKSTKERILPIIDETGGKPKSTTKLRRLADLKDINIQTILRQRKDEAIKEFNIDTEGLSKAQINKKIRQAHALIANQNPLSPAQQREESAPHSPLQSPPKMSRGGGVNPFNPFE